MDIQIKDIINITLFVSKDLETIMHQRYKILLTPKRHPIVCVYGKYIKTKSNN